MSATTASTTLWVRRPAGLPAAGWLRTVDHKEIGVLYMGMGLFFLVFGSVEAAIIRLQLAVPENRLVDPQLYDQLFTIHGVTMIFLVAIPILVGFMNYLIPLMIGARDVAFPRLNALSFWLSLLGGLLVYFSFVAGGGPDAGWFAYPPLSDRTYSTGTGLDYYVLGLAVNGAGTIVGAINIAVTVLLLRCPGLSISRLPLFVWMSLVTSLLILVAYPALSAALVMLFADRRLGAHFFDATAGGDPIIWQHVFWFFGHPEVYIVILPAFGMVSEVIPVFSRKPIFGYRFIAGSSVAIGFLSVSVWAHHMFAVGLPDAENLFFSAASMLIAVPTGIKVLAWTATMVGGRLRFTTAMLFAVGFIATFVMGGLTGVSLAIVPIDWYVTDSYYVVAHMHYVLFGGVVFGIFAGLYYWFPKMTGRLLSERLGKWHFWLVFVGFHLTFLPQHWLGIAGMPRRVFTYAADTGWGPLNLLSTLGAVVMGAGILAFVCNLVVSLRAGELAGDDPWDAWTLEWSTSSPPIPENFLQVPVATSKRPLWDRKHPDRAHEA
ncbi:MAG TPA: cytochrome c oxidase subunit I [Candidatus Limnocylindria bacterium]|nr:cytochrome c oxidase subunit I [Candidatus Limnocylindria bacterium]